MLFVYGCSSSDTNSKEDQMLNLDEYNSVWESKEESTSSVENWSFNGFKAITVPDYSLHTQSVWCDLILIYWRCRSGIFFLLLEKRVCKQMTINWRTVGSIVSHVQKAKEKDPKVKDENLEAIEVDETSHKKEHTCLTTIVNHKTGEIIWVHDGFKGLVLEIFFSLSEWH